MNKLSFILSRLVLPPIILGLLFYLWANYDPMVNRTVNLLICLLPLVFFTVYSWTPAIQTDPTLLTPKNLMLFIYFNKLVIIPIEILWIGNGIPLFDPHHSPLYEEISVTIVAFISFVIGWGWRDNRTKSINELSLPKPLSGYLKWVYLVIGVSGILLIFGSPLTYFAQAVLTKSRDLQEGTFRGFVGNITSRFLPFSVILFWASHVKGSTNNRDLLFRNILFVIICLFSTLSSNRANIIYPILSFLSVMGTELVVRRKLLIALLSLPAIALLFFFGSLRAQKSVDLADIPRLARLFYAGTDYLIRAHQVYFGSPYQITPLIGLDLAQHGSSLISSLMYPIPLLGKAFRASSGVTLYNGSIHGNLNTSDQVIPVAGELYYNLGLVGVALGHFLIGTGYQLIDNKFKHFRLLNKTKAVSLFYVALLYNSLIFLSISVSSQFIIYSALPALLILVL